jgi:hypothetical protein
MIDARTGKPQPCPVCGSKLVKWRARHLYDVPLTWLRWFGELLASALGGHGGGDRAAWRYSWGQVREEYAAELRETHTGLKTPTHFWRCADCSNNGYVFDGPQKPGRIEDRRRPPGDL